MGLSVTSSTPKNTVIGTVGQASASSAEAMPGDFLALLSSQLGNFLLPPTVNSSESLTSSATKSEPPPLVLESTETITPQIDPTLIAPQVDPALIASLNAAAKPIPAIVAAPLNSSDSTIAVNALPYEKTQVDGMIPELLSGQGPILSITPPGQSIDSTQTLAATPSGYRNLESKVQAFNFDLTQNTTQPLTQAAGTPALFSGLNLTNTNFAPDQPLSVEMNVLNNTAPSTPHLNPQEPNSRPMAHIESELKTHLQEPVWPQQFGEKILWLAKSDAQSAQININPPELGPIQITLNLSGDQAKISFASPHLEVRQTIENALPQLKEMLSSSGISLGQANVGSNLQQPPRETTFQNANGRHSAGENDILSGNEATLATGSSTAIQRGRGLVDLFA